MTLPLRAGNFHKGAGGQPTGPGKDVFGHSDFVVARELLNDFEGGVVERREALAEFSLGLAFDTSGKQTQHIVEDLDLIFAEPLSIVQEKICHLPKGIDTLFR